MESVEDKIISKMKKCGRGSVFFVNDFLAHLKKKVLPLQQKFIKTY